MAIMDSDQKKYNLGDYVWEDTNKDGKQDANERVLKACMSFLNIIMQRIDRNDNR